MANQWQQTLNLQEHDQQRQHEKELADGPVQGVQQYRNTNAYQQYQKAQSEQQRKPGSLMSALGNGTKRAMSAVWGKLTGSWTSKAVFGGAALMALGSYGLLWPAANAAATAITGSISLANMSVGAVGATGNLIYNGARLARQVFGTDYAFNGKVLTLAESAARLQQEKDFKGGIEYVMNQSAIGQFINIMRPESTKQMLLNGTAAVGTFAMNRVPLMSGIVDTHGPGYFNSMREGTSAFFSRGMGYIADFFYLPKLGLDSLINSVAGTNYGAEPTDNLKIASDVADVWKTADPFSNDNSIGMLMNIKNGFSSGTAAVLGKAIGEVVAIAAGAKFLKNTLIGNANTSITEQDRQQALRNIVNQQQALNKGDQRTAALERQLKDMELALPFVRTRGEMASLQNMTRSAASGGDNLSQNLNVAAAQQRGGSLSGNSWQQMINNEVVKPSMDSYRGLRYAGGDGIRKRNILAMEGNNIGNRGQLLQYSRQDLLRQVAQRAQNYNTTMKNLPSKRVPIF